MNIKEINLSLPFLIKSEIVPCLVGHFGRGKSQVVEQFAKNNGYSFHPYFLSQMSDTGDILGLPEFKKDKDGNSISVNFIHPDKLPKNKRSLLFFDELNRATKDIIQGVFQLILEKKIS